MISKNLIKIEDLSKEDILEILKLAREIKNNPKNFLDKLKGKSLATLFFQPSTRTRISSSLAMQKLGGNVVDLYESKFEKGMTEAESFEDTIKIIGNYVDIICLRHSLEDAPFVAEKNITSKIINCGNGKDEHPTQAILDLFTIWEEFGRLDNLKIAIIGDLKNSRSAHSLLIALSLFENNKIELISPAQLRMPEKYLKNIKTEFSEKEDFNISDQDITYMAGFPLSKEVSDEKRKEYCLDSSKLKESKTIIMNPLPRIDEISREVDLMPNARYFEQASKGLFARMAILLFLFEE